MTLNAHDTMKVLGQVAQLIYQQQGKPMPQGVQDVVLTKPLTGLAMMQNDLPRNKPALTAAIGRIVAQIPSEITNGPVSIEDQGGFWLGWYKTIKLDDAAQAEVMATVHFDLPAGKKAAYVRAAQAQGVKLIPWIIDKLDRAAEEDAKSN